MNSTLYFNIWKNHPGRESHPCDRNEYPNQCAIRMSVALHLSKIDLVSFSGAKCWMSHEDDFKHILRAQELAEWMHVHPEIFGHRIVLKNNKKIKLHHSDFWKYKGLIFIQDGWGPTDHIDIWNGSEMKGGTVNYLDENYKEVWVWSLI